MEKPAIVVQARLSSVRFPRKVLISIAGMPLILHIAFRLRKLELPLFVLTSNDYRDDELVSLLRQHRIDFFRGDLTNVLERYNSFLSHHSFASVIRISADSPLIHPAIVIEACNLATKATPFDIITNVFPRSFPRGQSVEVINKQALGIAIDEARDPADFEHVTSFFYRNNSRFKIVNFSSKSDLSSWNLCVDQPNDISRLKTIFESTLTHPETDSLWNDWDEFVKVLRKLEPK